MENIHISGFPGCGKTSYCLGESKKVLLDSGRVFWLTSSPLDVERFSQIMGDLPISNASKFHSMEFGENILNNNTFENAVIQLINMCGQLTSTKLVVIDGWDGDLDEFSKKYRIENISKLIKTSEKNDFRVIITSTSYEDASNNSEKYKVRSKSKFESMGLVSWLVIPGEEGFRIIIKPDDSIKFKMVNDGIKIIP